MGFGVVLTGAETPSGGGSADLATTALGDVSAAVARQGDVSRSAVRPPAAAAAVTTPQRVRVVVPKVARTLWTVEDLDLRLAPREQAKVDGVVEALRRIGVTGVRRDGFAQVVVGSKVRWVTAEYLVEKKPVDPADLRIAGKPCPGSSGVENGLTANAVRVYRAVCNAFPEIHQYGGWDDHGEHSSGRAVDVMISDVALGNKVAEFLRAHAGELHLFDIIWRQRIFTPDRSGEGWRPMSDRGSETANHYDHVHVSVY